MDIDMPTAIARVVARSDLSRQEMSKVIRLVMTGEATESQIGGFLIGLRMKGETVDEIAGAAEVMRELVIPVEVDQQFLVDTCGTGGSGSGKFNVSTASAFVAAASGARVAKHGNRAASGKSGSADLLEAAGAEIMLSPSQVAHCINKVGVGFMFAVSHHSAMRHAIGARREMVVRTIFNMLGPLTNPARARRQILGVYDGALLRATAEVLRQLDSEHVMVVHAEDGLDEISVNAVTHVAELKNGEIKEYDLSPEDFGFSRASLEELRIENAGQSLALVQESLVGTHEAASAIVALNAGAAIYVSGQALSLELGTQMAKDSIRNGLALKKLNEFVGFTQKVSAAEHGS